jgi:hypothetical protein
MKLICIDEEAPRLLRALVQSAGLNGPDALDQI